MESTLYIDTPAYALKIIIIKFHIKKTKIGVFHTFIIGLTNIRIFTEAEETARSAAPSLLRMASLIAPGQKTIRS